MLQTDGGGPAPDLPGPTGPAGPGPVDDAAVEARADELWERRNGLTPVERAQARALPLPYGNVFAAYDARRAGRRSEALLLTADALPHTRTPSRWRAHALRLQAALLADVRLTDQAVVANNAAQACARAIGDTLLLATCLQDLSTYPHQSRERIDELLTEAAELAADHPASDLGVLIAYNRAWWLLEGPDADVDELLAAFADVERRAADVWPDLSIEARAYRARVAARAGRFALAEELAAGLPAADGIEDEETLTALACAQAWVLADRGDVDGARDVLMRLLPDVTEERRTDLRTTLTEVLGHAGRYADAWRASQDLVRAVKENADTLGTAQARSLEVWFRTQAARDETRTERARADELETALAELRLAHERIRELSGRDLLTGVYNRQQLRERGQAALLAAGPDTPVQIALVDLDAFKAINDTYGHLMGDRVLLALAELAREVLDPGDLLVRYGGEEFVVVRPTGIRPKPPLETDLRTIGRRFAGLSFSDARGRGPSRVTISGGLVRASGGDLEDVLWEADQLMYAAKRDGGNRLYTQADRPDADGS